MTVYLIRNRINGKCYVGQTSKGLSQRWKQHLSPYSSCRYLKAAIVKYGAESFEMVELAKAESFAELNDLEHKFICGLNTLAPNGYNLNLGGLNRKASVSTRLRMSATRTGIPLINRRGLPAWNLGLKTNKKQSTEHVTARVNAATRAKLKPIVCIDTGIVYPSSKAAVAALGLSQGNLSSVLNGSRTLVNGLRFKFV